MNIYPLIEELLNKKTHIIDIFPMTVPQKADDRYFAAEKYFQRNRADLDRKLTNIILKLYCYYDMTAVTADNSAKNPDTEEFVTLLYSCFSGGVSYVNILLPECEVLLTLNSDDLYMTVYNAQGEATELISQLVSAEGLFFRRAE
ncbi:hypothetical protein [uncultured Ruminococcus sp.]|uniref:hypothetical protein n=1 Tax=uncultured Ruminococcus sp. TaxID=165186 RepID=UPI0026003262|nr:hypothetical protein [uncultured Ruminococcus sp.]